MAPGITGLFTELGYDAPSSLIEMNFSGFPQVLIGDAFVAEVDGTFVGGVSHHEPFPSRGKQWSNHQSGY